MLSRRALALASRAAIKRSPLGARSVHVEASVPSVQAAIKNEPVLVFSKTHCPHCARVKALFADLKVDFELVELDLRPDGADIQAILLDLTKQRTVPNVFIKGQHIGGCDSTFALHDADKLVPLLK